MKKLTLIALIVTLATNAFAHSEIETTSPADGAVVAAVPAEVSIRFANEIRLTRVDMTHADHPSVQIDLSAYKRFDRDFLLPIEAMGPGTYRFEWRGLGTDGHPLQGEFMFTVD